MNKANPVEMRIALEAVNILKQAGIRFVPIPAIDDDNYKQLQSQLQENMDKIFEQIIDDLV